MKRTLSSIFTALVLITATAVSVQAQNSSQAAACANEDFELGTFGAISATSGVSGWSVYKIVVPPTPFISNCALYTNPLVTYTNPSSAFLFTANGYIDTLLGSNYPVYSVFGSGASNGGESFNPSIPAMYGTSFCRIGDASGASYNHHAIEKTFAVTTSNALFRFAYLSVVKNGSSNCCDAPSVQIRFINASQGNTLLACPVYSTNGPTPGCFNSSGPTLIATTNTSIPSLGTYYHKWKVEAVDLSAYIGTNVTFKAIVTSCATGCAKFGYCYLDAQCGPMEFVINGSQLAASSTVNYSGCGMSTATIAAPPDFSGYTWSGPSGFTSTLATITTSVSGTYTLNITNSNSCSAIVKYVNVQLNPSPTVTALSSKTTICKGSTATLSLGGLATYSLNGQSTNSLTSVKPTVTTTYTVSGLSSAGCPGSKTLSIAVDPCTGMSTLQNENNSFVLFPNPASTSFFLNFESAPLKGKISIRNSLGQLVLEQTLSSASSEVLTTDFSTGIYFYYVMDGTEIIGSGKLIIE